MQYNNANAVFKKSDFQQEVIKCVSQERKRKKKEGRQEGKKDGRKEGRGERKEEERRRRINLVH